MNEARWYPTLTTLRTARSSPSPAWTTSARWSRARTRSTTRRPRSGRTGPEALLPHLPRALPDRQSGKIFYSGVQRRLRAGRHGPRRPASGTWRRNELPRRSRAERPGRAGDVVSGAAAARAGPEVHGARRRRGRRVEARPRAKTRHRRPARRTTRASGRARPGRRAPATRAASIMPDDTVLTTGGSGGLPRPRRHQHPQGARSTTRRRNTLSAASPTRWWAATTTPGRCCCPTAG